MADDVAVMKGDAVSELERIGLAVAERSWDAGSGGNASLLIDSVLWIKASGERFASADRSSWVAISPESGRPLSEGPAPSVERAAGC